MTLDLVDFSTADIDAYLGGVDTFQHDTAADNQNDTTMAVALADDTISFTDDNISMQEALYTVNLPITPQDYYDRCAANAELIRIQVPWLNLYSLKWTVSYDKDRSDPQHILSNCRICNGTLVNHSGNKNADNLRDYHPMLYNLVCLNRGEGHRFVDLPAAAYEYVFF